jgi:hypothetical protein
MYNLVSAIGKNKQLDGRWESVDIGSMPLNAIFLKYSVMLVTLANPFYKEKLGLDLGLLQSKLVASEETFNEFLISNGNKTLPTIIGEYKIDKKYARYKDAFQANYTIIPVKPGASFDAELPRGDKTNLYVTRANTSMGSFTKHCMVTVNGFFHRVDGSDDGAWVVDGNVSCVQSGQNLMGLLNFQGVGKLKYLPIKESMIGRHFDKEPLGNRAVINLGIDVVDKTLILVLGGYMHILDEKTFYRVGKQSVMIDFNNIPMLERYYESKKFLDLSSLPMEKSSNNEDAVAIGSFFSDDNIKAYLTLSQTFVVVLDNPYIYLESEGADNTELAGQVISYGKPELPLFNEYGRVLDYWDCGNEMGQHGLSVVDHGVNNHIFNTTNPNAANVVSRERVVGELRTFGHCSFLRICTDIQTD